MTFEELKRYDRCLATFMNFEGMLYVSEDSVYILNNRMSGLYPKSSDEWRELGYKYSWYIHPNLYDRIELPKPVDFNKLDKVLGK